MNLFARLLPSAAATAAARFERLISQRSGRWYQACLRITGDANWAEDAVQDALLKAWHGRERFRGESELDTWVHRIAINAALDRMRRERLRSPLAVAAESVEGELAGAGLAPALASDLNLALAQLTDLERVCFVLKHLEQWRLEEIAEQLDSSLGSVKQALFRALRKLRDALQAWRSPT
ncbi:MAG: RNA polymerase sigma factor [Xanthomonadales bacterium]|nr:RNA polymerase sigma factor [Xanthomonadales bacterium]